MTDYKKPFISNFHLQTIIKHIQMLTAQGSLDEEHLKGAELFYTMALDIALLSGLKDVEIEETA